MHRNGQFTDISPIFVVGSPRSGTTLLQMLLNAHSRIGMMGELHFFDEILQLRRDIPTLAAKDSINSFFQQLGKAYCLRFIPGLEGLLVLVRDRMLVAINPSYEIFYRFVMEEFGKREQAARVGEKTPSNIRYLEDLLRIFPHARIIHIVRDPRATIASIIKAPFGANDVVVNSVKWKIDYDYSQQFKRKHPQSLLEIRYETLVTHPQQQLEQVCQFIGEQYEGKMLEFYKQSSEYLQNEPWKLGVNSPVNSAAVVKWKQELSPAKIMIIEAMLGKDMDRLGYIRNPTSIMTKLISPFVFLQELTGYLKQKLQTTLMRRATQKDLIIGTNQRLFRIVLNNILKAGGGGSRSGGEAKQTIY